MIEIVVTCYAAKLPLYATLMRAQLSSLVQHPPAVPVLVTVCTTPRDDVAAKALMDFEYMEGLDLLVLEFPAPELWRRSIPRNKAASGTMADLVWFTDADYWFGPGCLDAVWQEWLGAGKPDLIWPAEYYIQTAHTDGDAWLDRHTGGTGLVDIDTAEFSLVFADRAIGGLQIVSGDFARTHGYLRDSRKWQTPTDFGYATSKEDVDFRKFCERTGRCQPIPRLPLYRLRHSEVGYSKVDRDTTGC